MRLPERVHLVETGPGDGFPRETLHIPTRVKVEVLARLAAAGVAEIVAVAFAEAPAEVEAEVEAEDEVRGRLADAATVLERAGEELPGAGPGGARLVARCAGPRGAGRALAAGAGGLAVTVAASAAYSRQILDAEPADGEAAAREVLAAGVGAGVPVSVTLAAAFGCPLGGPVAERRVVELVRRWAGEGAAALVLDDASGLGDPALAGRLAGAALAAIDAAGTGAALAVQPGDSRGLGLAVALAALDAGVASLSGAIAGVGGSPAEPGVAGAVATEDLATLCAASGIATGVDLSRLRRAARRVVEAAARPLPTRSLSAEPRESLYRRLAAGG